MVLFQDNLETAYSCVTLSCLSLPLSKHETYTVCYLGVRKQTGLTYPLPRNRAL